MKITKKFLDELYKRPEKYPFERLNALMEYALYKIKSTKNK